MRLRALKMDDAVYMLEWMHSDNVVHYLDKNFKDMTINECREFVGTAIDMGRKKPEDQVYLHLAIADDQNDEYLGTVSLKNIDRYNKTAEFGVAIREKAMGKNVAAEAMRQMFELGFSEYGLNSIYWYVNEGNKRALRFYVKNQYKMIDEENPKIANYVNSSMKNKYIWFLIEKDDAGN